MLNTGVTLESCSEEVSIAKYARAAKVGPCRPAQQYLLCMLEVYLETGCRQRENLRECCVQFWPSQMGKLKKKTKIRTKKFQSRGGVGTPYVER